MIDWSTFTHSNSQVNKAKVYIPLALLLITIGFISPALAQQQILNNTQATFTDAATRTQNQLNQMNVPLAIQSQVMGNLGVALNTSQSVIQANLGVAGTTTNQLTHVPSVFNVNITTPSYVPQSFNFVPPTDTVKNSISSPVQIPNTFQISDLLKVK